MLLEESLQCHTNGTYSEPHELSPKHARGVHDAFAHLKGTFLCFCRKAEASGPWAKLTC
jgi:hypothetical protein